MRYYGKKAIILLDEYDTPLQEAYVHGYWDEMISFTRRLFNQTFKTNPYLGRAVMTGITRISKEPMFSDLNNLVVVTTTSEKYADAFGFTQQEVWDALEAYGLSQKKEGSNSLAGKLIREGSARVKETMEDLLDGKVFYTRIDEQIVFSQLDCSEEAIWSLLLASGYLRVESLRPDPVWGWADTEYGLTLTNKEVRMMFSRMAYAATLEAGGIIPERIRKYGFAFEGKKILGHQLSITPAISEKTIYNPSQILDPILSE